MIIIYEMTLLTMATFFSFNKTIYYLNYYFSKVVNAQHAVIFWSTLMIVMGEIVQTTSY